MFQLAVCAEMVFRDLPFVERVKKIAKMGFQVEIWDWTRQDSGTLVEGVSSPHLRLNLDLYHAQIGEGNLIDLVRRALPFVGEIQVADVPGRCEPGTGEINYPAIAQALADAGYRGTVALEAWASGNDETALQRFREAFSVHAGVLA